MLLIVGFISAYFWWIVTVVALTAFAWLFMGAYPVARAEFDADA